MVQNVPRKLLFLFISVALLFVGIINLSFIMEKFTNTFLEISRRFHEVGNALAEWEQKLALLPPSSGSTEFVLRERVAEFSGLLNQTIGYQDQLLYFFFREEIQWQEFLLDPKALIEDPFFNYEKTPLLLKEAHTMHLLHQYSWLQVLKKLAQLDPNEGSLIFLLPPAGEKEVLQQPDYLPECVLMEASIYKNQPIFYCWTVILPKTDSMTFEAGEHISQLYHHIEEHFDHPPQFSLEEYIFKMKESLQERKKEGVFENVSTFGGARDKKEGHIYFLYWTEFHVFMCTLDINKLQDTLEQKIRKNALLPYNTIFCEPDSFRKFRLEFEEEEIEQKKEL